MTARQIIIDTDPGQDDAVAILLALACPDALEVLGITCVAGNVPLEMTTRNARIICELAGKVNVPIHAGCDRPLGRDLVTAEHVHGRSGLDGPNLPAPVMPLQDKHGVDFIIDTLRERPAKSVTLVPIGPLTNIASAFKNAPDIIEKVEEIILMGGAHFSQGNVTPVAEFNIHVDPQAAEIVFGAGVPLVMMPLDVTHKALVTRARNAALRAIGTPVGRAVADLTGFFERYNPERYGEDGAPLHDPCTIGWLLKPELFKGRRVNVMIETQSELTMGMTVTDWWGATDRPPNATFIHNIDAEGFFDLLTERLARL
ncbi:Pyrimidine-specific ribonucleoside hydrolase RihA [Roseovarius gaetbuli]|uniref:Pyrimidine-specific ribonucleoside hydrolase RihA n=1 Tax=Roseovarius gaetbuli TaxID=1356575 RepID=A0A1X6ZKN8_9RHOB|nr:nucleoside hydrolase [Roseovarius gaetbuli]SLN53923.1 Pyrimidine-specific ribonucleoside hydrolase RihA [Roseovarius gaetbuli]